MFSACGHVLGLSVNSLSVEFWYFTRSAGYGSVPQSFGESWQSIAILLLAIGEASTRTLGLDTNPSLIGGNPGLALNPGTCIR